VFHLGWRAGHPQAPVAGLRLAINISFTPAFAGAHNIHYRAEDNGIMTAGWAWIGTWVVPLPNQPPLAASVTPSSASGLGPQTFQFPYSDPNGYQNLKYLTQSINTSLQAANGCLFLPLAGGERLLADERHGNAVAGADHAGDLADGGEQPVQAERDGHERVGAAQHHAEVRRAGHFQAELRGLDGNLPVRGGHWRAGEQLGAEGTWTVPATVQRVITSAPTGRSLTVDGAPCTAPCTFQWTAGTQHTIATTTPRAGGAGTQHIFASWLDGGAISQTITASSSAVTYTAGFTTQHTTLRAIGNCISSSPNGSTWRLALGTYTVTTPIPINHRHWPALGCFLRLPRADRTGRGRHSPARHQPHGRHHGLRRHPPHGPRLPPRRLGGGVVTARDATTVVSCVYGTHKSCA